MFPPAFLPHIRPLGTPASEVVVHDNPLIEPTMEGQAGGLKSNLWPLIAGLPLMVGACAMLTTFRPCSIDPAS